MAVRSCPPFVPPGVLHLTSLSLHIQILLSHEIDGVRRIFIRKKKKNNNNNNNNIK